MKVKFIIQRLNGRMVKYTFVPAPSLWFKNSLLWFEWMWNKISSVGTLVQTEMIFQYRQDLWLSSTWYYDLYDGLSEVWFVKRFDHSKQSNGHNKNLNLYSSILTSSSDQLFSVPYSWRNVNCKQGSLIPSFRCEITYLKEKPDPRDSTIW